MSWEGPDPRRDEDIASRMAPSVTGEVRRLLADAASWDREADKLARQNPVFLRDAIRSCRDRAKKLRFQARLEEQAQERKDAA